MKPDRRGFLISSAGMITATASDGGDPSPARSLDAQAVGKLDGRAPRNSCLATSAPWFMQPMWVRLVLISAENKWAPAETCLFRLGRVIFWPKMPRRHERKASDAGHRHRVGPDPDGGRRKNFP